MYELEVRRHKQHSQVWLHEAENNYTFDFEGAEVIAQESMKGGHLLKTWLSNHYSINRHVKLLPPCQILRRHEQQLKESVGKPFTTFVLDEQKRERVRSLTHRATKGHNGWGDGSSGSTHYRIKRQTDQHNQDETCGESTVSGHDCMAN